MNNKIYLTISLLIFAAFSSFSQTSSWIENATTATGMDSAHGGTVYTVDVNGDNYPDIVLIQPQSVGSRSKLKLYLNKQKPGGSITDRMFVDITSWSGIDRKRNGDSNRVADLAAFADVNNDGFVDCISCIYYHRWEYYHPDSLDPKDRCELLLGNGTGQFNIKTDAKLNEIGLTNATGLAFIDYNNDGNLDLFISQWFMDYANNIMMPSILMKNNGDATFTDVSTSSGIKANYFPLYGINATDWNNDGWMDLATCPYCRSSGSLWKNNKNGTFSDVAVAAGYNTQVLNGEGWGDVDQTYAKALCTWAAQPADYDNDGDMDFFYVLVHGGFYNDVYGKPAGRSTLVVNHGADSNYKLAWALDKVDRKTPRSYHLGDYDASWFDLDNDMWQDLVMGNGSYAPSTRLFIMQQDKDHNLIDISPELDILSLTKRYDEIYSIEVFDYDLDGDDDIIFVHGLADTIKKKNAQRVEILKNNIGQTKNWIGIKLKSPANCNENSVGARIIVYSGGVAQLREIKAGFGHFGGQQPFITNFGLAANTKVDSVIIRWPTDPVKYTKILNPPINQISILDDNGYWGTLAIKEDKQYSQHDFTIYPNPASDEISVKLDKIPSGTTYYEVFDLSGKVMLNGRFDSRSNFSQISLSKLEKGYYMIRITYSDKSMLSKGFMISQ
jgi:hypothetical protein